MDVVFVVGGRCESKGEGAGLERLLDSLFRIR